MLRRTATRSITAYEFGHPNMTTGFTMRRGVQAGANSTTQVADSGVKTTVLPNGVTVKTHDRQGATASLGFFIEAGAIYDPAAVPGLSYAMRWALLTGNLNESQFQIDRALRSVGASYGHTEVRKRWIGVTSDSPAEGWKVALEHFATGLACPRFSEPDVEKIRDTMDAILEEQRWQNPREFAALQLENLAFMKEQLGSPRLIPVGANDYASTTALLNQYASYFTPDRVTIAAVNVSHEEVIAAYSNLPFKHSKEAPHFAAVKPRIDTAGQAKQWQGLKQELMQEHRAKNMGVHPEMVDDAIVAVGWLSHGADADVKEYATALVTRELLNIKTEDVMAVNRSDVHFGVRTFYKPYSSAGLIGLTVRGLAADVPAMAKEAIRLPAAATSTDASKAKARAAVAFYNEALETQQDYLAFLATSAFTPEQIRTAIDGVKTEDVTAALKKMADAKPCMYGHGAVEKVPSIRKLMQQ
jgi:processing peptidase subunit alpha